ncbi:hypothetical protein [Pseudodesulfovibrio sediminis]|uniref:hypothetical protein n=1 Tax=Pseudodesulfovibrio sediminis TaxID=2810563 RepID=UPI001E463405|nr:hypothetical protein [Pseudodesulfovibrio sediminis]
MARKVQSRIVHDIKGVSTLFWKSLANTTTEKYLDLKERLFDFVADHPVFFISVPIWIFLWMFIIAPMPTAAGYIWLPAYALALLLSLVFVLMGVLRAVAVFVWTGVVALLLIIGIATPLSIIFAVTDNYYIGVDVNTPSGLKSCTSMVQLKDSGLKVWALNPYSRQPKVKGEAVYCDLGDGKNLVALLSFQGDHYGLHMLHDLPWRAAGHRVNHKEKYQPFINGRHDLIGDLTPILVTFSDTNDRNSMTEVSPDSMSTVYGEGFTISRIWVEMTDDPYLSSGIKEHLPWVKGSFGGMDAYQPFKSIGIHNISQPFIRGSRQRSSRSSLSRVYP